MSRHYRDPRIMARVPVDNSPETVAWRLRARAVAEQLALEYPHSVFAALATPEQAQALLDTIAARRLELEREAWTAAHVFAQGRGAR